MIIKIIFLPPPRGIIILLSSCPNINVLSERISHHERTVYHPTPPFLFAEQGRNRNIPFTEKRTQLTGCDPRYTSGGTDFLDKFILSVSLVLYMFSLPTNTTFPTNTTTIKKKLV